MQGTPLKLAGVQLVRPERHRDERGFLSEVFNRRALAEVGVLDEFVQENHILTRKPGTIRGLHFQVEPRPSAKLLRVVSGSIFDVVVDLRHGSSTYGDHLAVNLSASSWEQIYVPVGFAHGFCSLEPDTEVTYRVSDYWSPEVDRGLLWNDPDLGIQWPIEESEAIVSEKDQVQPRLVEMPRYFTN